MFGAIGRAWRAWRDKSQLLAPMLNHRRDVFFAHDLQFSELLDVMKADGPRLLPYQGMASVWNDYGSAFLPAYPAYLVALGRRNGIALRCIMDLACGSGLLTSRLTKVAAEVVGLDSSESMLAAARKQIGHVPGVDFIQGDFRDFALGRQFDAVVCASNSLNYVADRGELGQVFAAVAKHLRPGGSFVFDTTSELSMRTLSGLFLHALRGDRRFAIEYAYDSTHKKQTARVILPTGVETHLRIPLGPSDVTAAIEGTGLEIKDYFSSALLPRDWGNGYSYFFVLARKC